MISLLNKSNVNFEERKRALLRREMNDAYKKHATYNQKKNPMLEALENLLNGKSEKDLNEENLLTLLDEEIQTVESIEQKHNDLQNNSNERQLSPINNFEHGNLSLQNFPHVQHATNSTQETKSQLASGEEDELFADEPFDFEIPERFLQSFDRSLKDGKSFERDLESLLLEKTFHKAVSTYTHHMQMVQNGFQLNPSQFSLTA